MLIVERTYFLGCDKSFSNVASRNVAEVVRHRIATTHLLVTSVTTCSKYYTTPCIECERCTVGSLADHSRHRATFIGQQFLHGGIVDYLAAQVVLEVESERGGDLTALAVGLSAASGGIVDAPRLQAHVNGLDVEYLVVRLEHAIFLPGQDQLVVRHGEDFLGVALDSGLDGAEPLYGAVEVVNKVAGLARIHEFALAVADLHEVVVNHVLVVVYTLALLPFGTRAKELAAGARGGAAGNPLLFDYDYVSAGLLDLNGCGKAAGARTAYDDVDGAHLILVVGRDRSGGRTQGCYVVLSGAGRHERRSDGAEDGLACDVRADDGRDIQALILDDELGEELDRGGVQTPGDAAVFAVLGYLHFEDFVLRYGDVHVELSAVAAGKALICARIQLHFQQSPY